MKTDAADHITFDYFHRDENEQYLFLQLPLLLIRDDQFKNLSDGSKILYSLLLNRTALSARNGWFDEMNRVYIIYTIEDIMVDLNCWKEKATKLMKELKTVGLIKTIRRGLGKPNLIYVMNFATVLKYRTNDAKIPSNPVDTRKFENRTSGSLETEPQRVRKSNPIYINSNNIYRSDTKDQSSQVSPVSEPSSNLGDDGRTRQDTTVHIEESTPIKRQKKEGLPQGSPHTQRKTIQSSEFDYTDIEKKVKDQIMYDQLIRDHKFKQREIDEIVNVIVDVHMTVDPTIRIDGETKALSLVKGVYTKLRYEHIIYAIEQFNERTDPISNKRKYLRSTLFNAVHELTSHNNNLVATAAF